MHNSAVRLCNISGDYMSNARTSGSGGSFNMSILDSKSCKSG